MKTRTYLLFAAIAMVAVGAPGQTNSIGWFKIAGGGGTSTNGQFTLTGTIGQADAGGPMTGGSFSLTGGFWAITAVQTIGAPLLSIHIVGNQAVISWPTPSAGFFLQQSPTPAPSGWVNFSGSTNVIGATNSVSITPAAGNLFFRLQQ